MINILNITLPKQANNNIFEINNHSYETFEIIAESSACLNNFKNVIWDNTNSAKHIKFNTVHKGLIKFDYSNPFEFYNYSELEKKINEKTKQFEAINWEIQNQLQYISACELYLWEVWLEQIKFIDLVFLENGV